MPMMDDDCDDNDDVLCLFYLADTCVLTAVLF